MKSKAIFGLFAFAVVSFGFAALSAQSVQAETSYVVDGKVRICHRTNSDEDSNNPYNNITVDINGVGNKGLGDHFDNHDDNLGTVISNSQIHEQMKSDHEKWGDIIPPTDAHPEGLNWSEEGQIIWGNECTYSAPTPEVDFCDPSQKPSGISIARWLELAEFNGADCFAYSQSDVCGSFNVQFTRNDTPYDYEFRYVIGSSMPANWEGDGTLPVTFSEDQFGGQAEVTYYAVGPEKDYFVGFGIPNFWDDNGETVTVDTNCEGSQGGHGGNNDNTPDTSKTPVTPASTVSDVEVAELPNTAGSMNIVLAVAAVSLVGLIGAAVAIKSRLLNS